MNATQLKEAQAPLKGQYRTDPASALITLRASGALDAAAQVCRVTTHIGVVGAGLHPATGGTGLEACSGDMLLEALVGCAGVTLGAVATAMSVEVRGGTVVAEGDLDFRGTLGVARDASVGFERIRLRFDLDTDAPAETVAKLVELTERYCVVLQTLRRSPAIAVSHATAP